MAWLFSWSREVNVPSATGALRPLGRETWNERRRRLEQLGGAPPGVEE